MGKIYGDRLHREEYVEKIIELIKLRSETGESTTFSIEAPWGQGKTWLIDKIEASLKSIDITKEYKSEELNKGSDEFFLVHYNAWERDYYDEPLLAILLTIINALNEQFGVENMLNAVKNELIKNLKKQVLPSLLAVASHVSKQLLHFGIVDLGKRGINKYKKIKEAGTLKLKSSNDYSDLEADISQVINALNKDSEQYPIIFIVDELDRCIPTFAIKTLERLHHIFDRVNKSITILAINRSQLLRSINYTYGEGAADQYLSKFIDFRINLNEGNTDQDEVNSCLEKFMTLFTGDPLSNTDRDLISRYNTDLPAREFEHILKQAILIHKLVGVNTQKFPIECMVAEILLQIKQYADELEGNEYNTSIENGNTPKNKLGKAFKNDLLNYRQKNPIVIKVYNWVLQNQAATTAQANNVDELTQKMQEFYIKYKVYYNLVKHS